MSIMDDYLDTPMDAEDVFPCKGCGEILEEGKAFELAGNRWHLDCFRCNTCNTLLDSDANLLLLGDGSLICNNCTYSCSACNQKIEDLAILTGDQAFCATCFRCRNCKRKIENLRYARTSQGIFCMSCHESLMARRRKKSKAAAQAKSRDKENSPMITEKSLPALPPNAIPPNAFASERGTPDSDTPTELSPRPRPSYQRDDSRGSSRPLSLERPSDSGKEGLAPPASGYRNNRNSTMLSGELNLGDSEGFFIPVALDPSPAPSITPRSTAETFDSTRSKDRDYFASARPGDKKSESQASTPHIAFQERNRQVSSEYETQDRPTRKLSKRNPAAQPPATLHDRTASSGKSDEFKLQDAPKSKKLISRRDSASDTGRENGKRTSVYQQARDDSTNSPTSQPEKSTASRSSQESKSRDEDVRPSLDSVSSRTDAAPSKILRKEVPSNTRALNGRAASRSISEGPPTPDEWLSPSRPGPPETKLSDSYMQPRMAPVPPTHTPKDSQSSIQENPEPKNSPKLPRWSAGGDFSMDEDMARILGTDEGSSSIMRRVSNAVRHGRNNSIEGEPPHPRGSHGRSVSETTQGTAMPRWPKTPVVDEEGQDDSDLLRQQLRNSKQRVAELERQFNTEKDLKSLNKKLIEKRKTVSVLDTQAEIMIRQLEVLAGYVERAKKTNEPLDARDLEESAIKEFVQKLEKVKAAMSASIEQLHSERAELLEERDHAIAEREKALLEFEQLSSKNAQLADMNNDLTHQIQERFKSQIGTDLKTPNGLGIYSHTKGVSSASVNMDSASLQTASTLMGTGAGTDLDEPVVEGPTVVNMRKGQVKKFNWKKGGSKVAQNISKGINRAAVAFQAQDGGRPPMQQHLQQQQQPLSGDSIGLPYNMTVAQVETPSTTLPPTGPQIRMVNDGRQGFGFFNKKGPMQKSMTTGNMMNASSPAAAAEAPSVLFGSDLVERADFERRQIPSVVTRCIEEVELRGMDIEGIYRKTGGNSQVKMIQEGFDKQEDFDISDPGMDITAVTSVLKQYFRRLPTPLLTFEVYERVLECNAIPVEAERCAHLQKTVNMLPQKHRDCLEFLMFHLARVASREKENLMSPKNLAVVFAPTIMRDHSLEKEMTDMHAKNLAVQFIIENSHAIFDEA